MCTLIRIIPVLAWSAQGRMVLCRRHRHAMASLGRGAWDTGDIICRAGPSVGSTVTARLY